jgi:hypothetical protein
MAAGLLIAAAIVLAGCAAQPTSSSFVRADGRPADSTQLRLALAKCKGEAETAELAAAGPYAGATFSNTANIVSACMARSGYLAQ